MKSRLVYIDRKDRGLRIAGVRFVSGRAEDALASTSSVAGDIAPESAAAWIAERVAPAATLDLLCLDADGGVCSWIAAPSADREVIASVARSNAASSDGTAAGSDPAGFVAAGAGGTVGGSAGGGVSASSVLGRYAADPSDSSIEPLSPTVHANTAGAEARLRVAVAASVDGVARHLLDELDRRGIECPRVCSVWHAMASAWDPAGPLHDASRPRLDADRVIDASASTPICIVLADPAGRVLWAWSHAGKLIAQGSARARLSRATPMQPAAEFGTSDLRAGEARSDLAAVLPDDADAVELCLTKDLAARLAADWLAWSAQIGVAPDRIVIVLPTATAPADGGGVTPAEFGTILASSWHGATVDLVVENDPVGSLLRRVADSLDEGDPASWDTADSSRSMVSLSNRPSAAHRQFYIWSSLAVTAAAVGIGITAWALRSSASKVNALTRQVEESWKSSLAGVSFARRPMPGMEVMELSSEVERVRRESMPLTGVEAARPILQEFEALSHVLALPDFELGSVSLDTQQNKVTIQVTAPDLSSGEALADALDRIAGSSVGNWAFIPNARVQGSDKVPCTYTGQFLAAPPTGTPSRPASGGASPGSAATGVSGGGVP